MFSLLRTPTFLLRQNQQLAAFSRSYASKNIFVGNLSWTVRNEDLGQLFSEYGTVKSARILSDRETGRSRGFGFVEMDNDEEADKAIEKLNGFNFKGRDLRVSVSDRKPGDAANSQQ